MTDMRLPRPRDPVQLGKAKLWEMADMVKVLENWENDHDRQKQPPRF
jgi:hypothetical protein